MGRNGQIGRRTTFRAPGPALPAPRSRPFQTLPVFIQQRGAALFGPAKARQLAMAALEPGHIALHYVINVKNRQIGQDRKSTRLNSSHVAISYAVFCLKKKNNKKK